MSEFFFKLQEEVRSKIIAAHLADELVIFIGAGVSRICGCWGWDKLAHNLIKKAYEEKIIEYRTQERLKEKPSQKEIISTCFYLFKKNKKENAFWDIMKEALLYEEKDNGKERKENADKIIYEYIKELGNYFITTNADVLFTLEKGKSVYQFDSETDLSEKTICHIHGCIEKRDSMVFTLDKYMEQYAKKHFKDFMQKVFKNPEYTVLFLGYGMAEIELLQFFFENNSSPQNTSQNRILFKGYYVGDEKLIKADQLFYKEMGIQIFPFWLDKNGYEKIIEELKQLLNQEFLFQKQIIDEAISNPNKKNIKDTIDIINRSPEMKEYLFKYQLARQDCPEPQRWLKPLKDAGYFDPGNNPPSESITQGGETYISQKYWNVTFYLEIVAEKNRGTPDLKITKLLIEIVKNIINYPKIEERIHNDHTDRSIIKILSYLPSQSVDVDLFESFLKDAIRNDIFRNLGYMISSLLVFGKDKKLGFVLLDSVLEFYFDRSKFSNLSSSNAHFYIETPYLKKILDEVEEPLINKYPEEVFRIVRDKIGSLIDDSSDKMEYPFIFIYTSLQEMNYVADTLIRLTKKSFSKIPEESGISILTEWLKDEKNALKMLAIELIDENYERYKELFWEIDWNPLVYASNQTQNLFAHHGKNFSDNEQKKAEKWIENYPYDFKKIKENLKDLDENYFKENQKSFKQALCEGKEPELGIQSTGIYLIEDIPPEGITKKTIQNILNKELINKINTAQFDKELNWKKERISPEGLGKELKSVFTEKPEKLLDDFEPFFKLKDYNYFGALFGALENVIEKNTIILDPKKVLNFLSGFIEHIKDRSENDLNKLSFVFTRLGWLLDKFFTALSVSLDKATDDIAKGLFLNVLPICPEEAASKKFSTFTMDDIINDGKCLLLSDAIGYLYYHYNKKIEYPENDNTIKDYLLEELNTPSKNAIYYIIGKEFLRLWMIDKKWVRSNIGLIFPEDSEKWRATFSRLILFAKPYNYELMELLIPQFERALKEFSFKDEKNFSFFYDRITFFITGHFLFHYRIRKKWSKRMIKLMPKLIKKASPKIISEMVRSIGLSKDIKSNKLAELWDLLLERFENKTDNDSKEVFSYLILWIKHFDLTDENIKRLRKTFRPFAQTDNYSFIELLENLVEENSKSIRSVANIFLDFMKAGNTPFYPDETIYSLVEQFYKAKLNDIVNEICHNYFKNGIYFLNPLWGKYGNKNDQ